MSEPVQLGSQATPDQLRFDIDRGLTGDKVAYPDPTVAPLGTDEEAAGTPVSGWAAALALKLETAHPPIPLKGASYAWIMLGFILLLAVLMIGSAFLR